MIAVDSVQCLDSGYISMGNMRLIEINRNGNGDVNGDVSGCQ